MIRRAAYQQVVVVDAPTTAILPIPTSSTRLAHSHAHSQQQQIHKIPIHLIKRSRAVLVKDLERLAPGVTRVVTNQGAVLYPDSPDTHDPSMPPSPRSPTFSGSSSSGGPQAYIPIPECEEDNSIWFVHSRPETNTARSIPTASYGATRDCRDRPASMTEHGSHGRAAPHTPSRTKKETTPTTEEALQKEVLLHHELEQEEIERQDESHIRTPHPPQMCQAQAQGLERICGQSQAASRTRAQDTELNAANRHNRHSTGSQAYAQHQDLDVVECGNPRCQEMATTLARLAQAVLAVLDGAGEGDIVALQKMATKILDASTTQATLPATPPQSTVFSSLSFTSAQGLMTPETTPVSTPVISASCAMHASPQALYTQHQRHPSSSSAASSLALSPPMTVDYFQTLPSAMITMPASQNKPKKKKSTFLSIFQHRREDDGRLASREQANVQGPREEGKKSWYKTTRRRLTLPTSTAPGPASSAHAALTFPGDTSRSTARRFSVPFTCHLKSASSSSNSSSTNNKAVPPTPPLPPPMSPMPRQPTMSGQLTMSEQSPTSGQRQHAHPASSRPPAQRHGSRVQMGTGSYLDSVSDDSTTEDDEDEEEVLQRRGVAPSQLLQQSLQRRERYQVYDTDESTDTTEDSEDDSDEDDDDDDEEEDDDDEVQEQVEEPRHQPRRPWRRQTMHQGSDQTRRTLEGYEHNFDDAPPPAYQSSDASLPPPSSLAASSSQTGTITPLSVSGSLARQYSIPPRNYPSATTRARAGAPPPPPPPPIPARPPSTSAFPTMQVLTPSPSFSSSSSSSLPIISAPLSTRSATSSSSAAASAAAASTACLPLAALLTLLHSLEARLHPSQRTAAFAKRPSSSPEREAWRARQPGTVASFAYVLLALEQTGLAPGAMRASWRVAQAADGGGKTPEEQWLAATGNAATVKDLARALLVLAKDGLGELAWQAGRDGEEEEEEGEAGSWEEWVERVEAYLV